MELHILHFGFEFSLKAFHISRHFGTDIGVCDRRNRALILLHLRHHVVGERDRNTGQHLLGNFLDFLFMGWVGVRIDQRDRQRLNIFFLEPLQLFGQCAFIQLPNHRAVSAHTLVRLNRARQRSEWLTLVVDHPTPQASGYVGARNLQYLLIAFGGHQSDFGARAGQDRIRRNRGAVHHLCDFRGIHPGVVAHLCDTVHHSDRGIRWRAGDFRRVDGTGFLINENQVGKCAADVDTKTIRHVGLLLL